MLCTRSTIHLALRTRILLELVVSVAYILFSTYLACLFTAEFTPQAYLGSDLDMFFRHVWFTCLSLYVLNNSFQELLTQSGRREASRRLNRWRFVILYSRAITFTVTKFSSAVIQTVNQTLDLNAESSLDLEYAMALTNPQPVTLLQVGDLIQS